MVNGKHNFFLQEKTEDASTTEDELRRFINGNGESFKNVFGRMSAYNANITVSEQYFYKRRREIKALIDQEVLLTTLCTFSSADNHWTDLTNFFNVDKNFLFFFQVSFFFC